MVTKNLVTTLKGSVENQNTINIGSIRIESVYNSAENTGRCRFDIAIGQNETVTAIIHGNGYFTDSNYSANQGTTKTLSTTGDLGNINNVYFISNAEDCFVEVQGIVFSVYFQLILQQNTYVNFDSLKYKRLYVFKTNTTVDVRNCLSGDVEDLKEIDTLVDIGLAHTSIYGDVEAFAKDKNIHTFVVYNTRLSGNVRSLKDIGKDQGIVASFFISRTLIEGALEEMLENWVANGTVTYGGAIGFSAYQSKCTLNNLPAPNDGLLTIANGNLTLTSSNGSVTYATYNGSIWTYGSW